MKSTSTSFRERFVSNCSLRHLRLLRARPRHLTSLIITHQLLGWLDDPLQGQQRVRMQPPPQHRSVPSLKRSASTVSQHRSAPVLRGSPSAQLVRGPSSGFPPLSYSRLTQPEDPAIWVGKADRIAGSSLPFYPRTVASPAREEMRRERSAQCGYLYRPERALTIWQIRNPLHSSGSSLAKMAALAVESGSLGVRVEQSDDERRAMERLFRSQADLLARLQWENPQKIFDDADADRGGSVSVEELRAALVRRGLSPKLAEPIVRELDLDANGDISRDEWILGFYSSRLCTVPLPPSTGFEDLTRGKGGCRIPETEMRAITLRQLKAVCSHIERRCAAEGWRNFLRSELEPASVTLYDATRYVIRPATSGRMCSYVELVAERGQRPKWFVSHWWGEFVFDFVACLQAHAKDRIPNARWDSGYWVCAYANNQWSLGEAIADDPGKTSFHRALSLAQGTVAVLDKEGIIFSRIWCCYEAHVSLTSGRPAYLFDIYTCVGNGKAVGLTDGPTSSDISGTAAAQTKMMRERIFPLELARRSIRLTCARHAALATS